VPYLDLEDRRLFYTDEGEGDPALLFVHGMSCDSHDWIWQLAHFTPHHRTIAVDLRGHGRSAVVQSGYGLGDYASDLVALIDHLNVEPVVAVGHSLGGMVVTVLAVSNPEKVNSLVVIDPGYLHPLSESEEAAKSVREQAHVDPIGLFRAMLEPTYCPSSPPALKTWHMRRLEGMDPEVLEATMVTVNGGGNNGAGFIDMSEEYLSRRACPVLVLYVDPERAKREEPLFSDRRSRAVAWPGVSHWPQQERADEFNALVESWLKDVDVRQT
jgi:pimeloyl-ACP methyl ester carboxylesterase